MGYVGNLSDGSWLSFPNVHGLSENANLTVRYASAHDVAARMEVRQGSVTGKLLSSCPLPSTGRVRKYEESSCELNGLDKDSVNIILLFVGGHGQEIARLDWLAFSKP